MGEPLIRAVRAADREAWANLWSAYLAFYKSELGAEVYDSTFSRLLSDDPWSPFGLVAELDGELVGLVHYLYHSTCWKVERVCYLQDLYAMPDVRGTGIGRALIEAVYDRADRDGAPTVYWTTEHHNAEARLLYDRIGVLTDFIRYDRT
ncbi:MAG: GNAT family N-acetyltransferase [Pseudomonadota bacterium]